MVTPRSASVLSATIVCRRVAPEAVEVVEHDGLKRARRRVAHHPLELGAVGEQRAAHAVVGVDVRLVERPALRRDERPRALDLARDGLRVVGDVVLCSGFSA